MEIVPRHLLVGRVGDINVSHIHGDSLPVGQCDCAHMLGVVFLLRLHLLLLQLLQRSVAMIQLPHVCLVTHGIELAPFLSSRRTCYHKKEQEKKANLPNQFESSFVFGILLVSNAVHNISCLISV